MKQRKLVKDKNFLCFIYEVRVKGEVTSEEENDFLELAKTKLKSPLLFFGLLTCLINGYI